ncbi:MAG: imidazole glycerol phosphate synthase subunit HisH [Desulfovibrio sp.]|nr:imidazole glycerol phosphate synthase subunit HisH [Desulfovibrio sp.]
MLGILDYKAGNPTSVRRALEYLGIPSVISHDHEELASCEGLVFPGVGAAGQAMDNLKSANLFGLLKSCPSRGQPLLGICLGCQILLEFSEENATPLLGLFKGECRRFPKDLKQEDASPAPIPHMGWNTLNLKQACPLFRGLPDNSSFYFVHSYYTVPDPSLILATTNYGLEFCSVLGQGRIFGVQFHAEKSGQPGLTVLNNFYNFCLEVKRTEDHAQ